MALTRAPVWIESLSARFQESTDSAEQRVLRAVRLVFERGQLESLGKVLGELAGDQLSRPRLFGRGSAGG